MYTVIQAVHSLLYIVAKCHFFSVVIKRYHQIFTKHFYTFNSFFHQLMKCPGREAAKQRLLWANMRPAILLWQ